MNEPQIWTGACSWNEAHVTEGSGMLSREMSSPRNLKGLLEGLYVLMLRSVPRQGAEPGYVKC